MRRVSDWRSQETASEFAIHDRADLAQEFLCRNADYAHEIAAAEAKIATKSTGPGAELEQVARDWGLSSPCAPDLSPLTHPAHWLPDFAPSVVILGVASLDSGPIINTLDNRADSILADTMAGDGRHIVVSDGERRHRLWLRQAVGLDVAAYATSATETDRIRLGATLQFNRWLHGSGPQLLRPLLVPTPYQRRRLVQLLRITDAQADGATLRDVAYVIVFPSHWPLSGAAWQGSNERRICQRLAAEARQLIRGEYRKLLTS